jgi:hypothetical protein
VKELQSLVLYLVATLTVLGTIQGIASYDLAGIWPSRRICVYRLEVNSPCFTFPPGE